MIIAFITGAGVTSDDIVHSGGANTGGRVSAFRISLKYVPPPIYRYTDIELRCVRRPVYARYTAQSLDACP